MWDDLFEAAIGKMRYLDDLFLNAYNKLPAGAGVETGKETFLKNMRIVMSQNNDMGVGFNSKDVEQAYKRWNYNKRQQNNKNHILQMDQNFDEVPNVGDNFVDNRGKRFVFKERVSVEGSNQPDYIFIGETGTTERISGGYKGNYTKVDNTISLEDAERIGQLNRDLYGYRQIYNDLQDELKEDFYNRNIRPIANELDELKVRTGTNYSQEGYDIYTQANHNWYQRTNEEYPNPNPNTSTNTTTNTSAPETTGPQPGDAYWDKAHNRQLIYDGPDEQWGGSRFLTRDGQIVNEELDNLVKYNGTRKLDYGVLKNYNKELDNFNQLINPNNKLKFSNPEEFYKQLTNSINSIDVYEKYVQGQYNKFKGNKDYHKNRKYIAKDINNYFGKDVIDMDPLNLKKDKNKNNNTNRNNNTRRTLTKEEQEAVDKANEAWRQQREKEFEQREKEMEEERRRTEEIFGSPEEIESENYRSNFDPEPDVNTMQTVDGVVGPEYGGVFQKKFDPNDPKTWREEDFEYLKDTDPDYYNELINEMNEAQTVKFDMNDPTTWTAEDFEYLKDTDPDYYNELIDQMNEAQKHKINFNESPFHNVVINEGTAVNKNINTGSTRNTSTGSSNAGSSNTSNRYGANIPSGVDPNNPATWTDEYIKLIANGDPDIAEEMIERRNKALGINTNTPNVNRGNTGNTNTGPNTNTPNTNNHGPRVNTNANANTNANVPNNYGPRVNTNTPNTPIPNPNNMPIVNPMYNTPVPGSNPILNTSVSGQGHKYSNGGTPRGTIGGSNSGGGSKLGKLSKMEMIGSAVNLIGAVGDYKAARREGRGVISSTVDAAARFAIGEALGWLYFPMELLRMAPGAIIKGSELLYQENRRMNSAAGQQVFGGVEFMDTQQLATMRQSGMEMAKMANYNLQQTLMGNEATYLHR